MLELWRKCCNDVGVTANLHNPGFMALVDKMGTAQRLLAASHGSKAQNRAVINKKLKEIILQHIAHLVDPAVIAQVQKERDEEEASHQRKEKRYNKDLKDFLAD